MGAYLSAPVRDKVSERSSAGRLSYGVSAMQGWRMEMEDAHLAVLDAPAPTDGSGASGGDQTAVFGVFDGHGGAEVAKFCQAHLVDELKEFAEYRSGEFGSALTMAFHKMDEMLETKKYQDEIRRNLQEGGERGALRDVVSQPDSGASADGTPTPNAAETGAGNDDDMPMSSINVQQAMSIIQKLQEAKRAAASEDEATPGEAPVVADGAVVPLPGPATANGGGSESNDLAFPRQCTLADHPIPAGCTSVVSVVHDGRIWTANAGDSKAVLSRGGQAYALSFEHKPNSDIEKRRIESAGGFVSSVGRVNNNLNLSRAIGDLKYKQSKGIAPKDQIITAEPDISVVDLLPEDEFVILACDGVWDVLSNQEAIDFVRERIASQPLDKICEEVFDRCIAEDPTRTGGLGGDNMTCIIVKIGPAGAETASADPLPDTTTRPASSGGTVAPSG